MYRVSVTHEANRPSVVIYQGESLGEAKSNFYCEVGEDKTICVEMLIWITHEGDKRGAWKTSRLYKRYR